MPSLAPACWLCCPSCSWQGRQEFPPHQSMTCSCALVWRGIEEPGKVQRLTKACSEHCMGLTTSLERRWRGSKNQQVNLQEENTWKAFKSKGLHLESSELQTVGYLESILRKYHMFLLCLFLCSSLPVWLFFAALFAQPQGSPKLQLLLRDLFGPQLFSHRPLVWPLSQSCSKLGAWEDILTGQGAKGSCTVPYIPWQNLYYSCLLSSQFTVTCNQGYSIHCHTVIRDKMCKNRDSPCCF